LEFARAYHACLALMGDHPFDCPTWNPARQKFVSRYDIEAYNVLSEILSTKMSGGKNQLLPRFHTFSSEPHSADSDLATIVKEAGERINNELLKKSEAKVGLVISIGGVITNAASGALLDRDCDFLPKILTHIKTAYPPCFQPLGDVNEPCLMDGKDRYPTMSTVGGRFVDYGLTVIDCKGAPEKPIRIVCAGTGGIGTIASVAVLDDTLEISDALSKTKRVALVVKGTGSSSPGAHYSLAKTEDKKKKYVTKIINSYAF